MWDSTRHQLMPRQHLTQTVGVEAGHHADDGGVHGPVTDDLRGFAFTVHERQMNGSVDDLRMATREATDTQACGLCRVEIEVGQVDVQHRPGLTGVVAPEHGNFPGLPVGVQAGGLRIQEDQRFHRRKASAASRR